MGEWVRRESKLTRKIRMILGLGREGGVGEEGAGGEEGTMAVAEEEKEGEPVGEEGIIGAFKPPG